MATATISAKNQKRNEFAILFRLGDAHPTSEIFQFFRSHDEARSTVRNPGMKETVQLELCGYCVATIQHGVGEDYRVRSLWRKFQGGVTVFLSAIIETFRACDGCGEASGTVRYGAVHSFEYETDDA